MMITCYISGKTTVLKHQTPNDSLQFVGAMIHPIIIIIIIIIIIKHGAAYSVPRPHFSEGHDVLLQRRQLLMSDVRMKNTINKPTAHTWP